MQLWAYLLPVATIGQVAMAYSSNCEGSFVLDADLVSIDKDCAKAISNIDTSATYNDGSQFSEGHCYLVYATNGSGDQPVSGQTIHDVAQSILDGCAKKHGSYGTGNCDACHVTVNYRS
ncbi:uncharacterized protein N7518_001132 [Penicillium psychrosexuale]|uniref:uncharacterized protein n=1 Tax=Penicillium psychrosexuale TaxID=1002107 RepID=UPI002545878D|nr:uncharacterized protein N7518_001132 [Penicillium psychrosexuale]KAJ5799064.1 hypothetical protein N7518_001132 [Penicillium psychrosexuale]